MIGIAAHCAANHAIGITHPDHRRTDQCQPATHFNPRHFLGNTVTAHFFPISCPVLMKTLIKLWIRNLDIFTQAQTQTEFCNAIGKHRRASHQNRLGELFIHNHLDRAQHTLVFAFCKNDARLGARTHERLGRREHWAHKRTRTIDKLLKLLDVGVEVSDRPCRHPALHRRFGNGRRDAHDQTGIKRLGYK